MTQEDGHIAWSSPIWVDYFPQSAKPVVRKNATKLVKKEKPVKKASLEEEEDDFNDDDDFDDEELE